MRARLKALLYTALVLFLLGGGYFFIHRYEVSQTKKVIASIVPVRENNFGYKFIYPLLTYNFNEALPFTEDMTLKDRVNSYIQTQYQDHNIENVVFYFKNLLTNQWSGVNEDMQFHPASMMKVLIMIGYYRQAQLDPMLMSRVP